MLLNNEEDKQRRKITISSMVSGRERQTFFIVLNLWAMFGLLFPNPVVYIMEFVYLGLYVFSLFKDYFIYEK